jgi:hypothetical protein
MYETAPYTEKGSKPIHQESGFVTAQSTAKKHRTISSIEPLDKRGACLFYSRSDLVQRQGSGSEWHGRPVWSEAQHVPVRALPTER